MVYKCYYCCVVAICTCSLPSGLGCLPSASETRSVSSFLLLDCWHSRVRTCGTSVFKRWNTCVRFSDVFRSNRNSAPLRAQRHVPRHSCCNSTLTSAVIRGINLMMLCCKMTSLPLAPGGHCANKVNSQVQRRNLYYIDATCKKEPSNLQQHETRIEVHV